MSCLARLYKPIEYMNHLYEIDLDGYVQVMHIIDKNNKDFKNFKKMTLNDVLKKYKGFKDVFITPNTSFNGKRAVCCIRQLRALYIDIDKRDWSFNDIVAEVWNLANKGEIPYPTMVINSGRGCHLYWRIKDAPYLALDTWQELEDYLYQQLKDLGADKQATDAVRLLRIPGTVNSKNGAECKVVLMDEDTTYSMYDLREEYLKWKPKAFKTIEITEMVNNKQVKNTVVQFFTSYSLHIARVEDILTLCELRGYSVTGYRNMIIHCYAYWLGVTTRDSDALEEQVRELNNKFTEPLKESEIKAILRCVPKAIDKFIAYEQGLRSGQAKRVSKGMRDKGGYWYKNETLIERLGITLEEQRQLKTIISKEVKYERRREKDNNSKKTKRRNENGLTNREQNKEDLIKAIQDLKAKGLSQSKVAKKLNKGIATVKRYWSN